MKDKNWKIIKNSDEDKPVNLSFIYFNNKYNNDLSNHYDAICINKKER